MEKEIFVSIEGYEGLYEVSNYGQIKSLSKKVGQGKGYYTKERILKVAVDRCGYHYVNLSNKDLQKKHKVHRLVAKAFVENPERKPQVNHIDGNKINNYFENLDWCTQEENMQHAYKIGLQKPIKGEKNVLSKSIIQYDLQGNYIQKFGSIREATRKFGGHTGDFCDCLKGRKKTYKNYIWKYEQEIQ